MAASDDDHPHEDLAFLRQVLRDMTHEIAAPLTPLFGHLDLLTLVGELPAANRPSVTGDAPVDALNAVHCASLRLGWPRLMEVGQPVQVIALACFVLRQMLAVTTPTTSATST